MAVYDLEEQEQIDAIKAWWKQWQNTIIAAALVFGVTFAGVTWWRHSTAQKATEASALYEELRKEKDPKKALGLAKSITDKYAGGGYASRAALWAAKVAFESGDFAGARAQLEWCTTNAKEPELQQIARLRLAAVLGEEKKFDEALRVLDSVNREEFSGQVAVLKGDLLAAAGKINDARAAYKTALEKNAASPDKRNLEMKLDMLGEAK